MTQAPADAGPGLANLLGALGDAVHDQAALAAAGRGVEAASAAALSALLHIDERPNLEGLRRVLGLSHSGAVRLVDRLVAAGWVRRGPGEDGRSRVVTLTDAGRAAAAGAGRARLAYLEALVARVSPTDRATLHRLLGEVMAGVVDRKDGGAWICRRCDLTACGRAEGACPTARAAARRYGLPPPG